jgi:hypothetical protein
MLKASSLDEGTNEYLSHRRSDEVTIGALAPSFRGNLISGESEDTPSRNSKEVDLWEVSKMKGGHVVKFCLDSQALRSSM